LPTWISWRARWIRLRSAGHLGVPAREGQARRHRLGVDAVRAPDHRRRRVLAGAPGERRLQVVDLGEDLIERARRLQRERRIEDVGRRHPEVEPACRLARELLDVGQKRDHVMPRRRLDREDPHRIELAGRGRVYGVRGPAGTVPAISIERHAASSISSHSSKRYLSSHSAASSGRL